MHQKKQMIGMQKLSKSGRRFNIKMFKRTLENIVNYIKKNSDTPREAIDELLMMGVTPHQLVYYFDFSEQDVVKSEIYKELDSSLQNELSEQNYPFILDGFEPVDAALISRFQFSKEEFLVFKHSDVYKKILEKFEEEIIEPETDVFNFVFDEFENLILNNQ